MISPTLSASTQLADFDSTVDILHLTAADIIINAGRWLITKTAARASKGDSGNAAKQSPAGSYGRYSGLCELKKLNII